MRMKCPSKWLKQAFRHSVRTTRQLKMENTLAFGDLQSSEYFTINCENFKGIVSSRRSMCELRKGNNGCRVSCMLTNRLNVFWLSSGLYYVFGWGMVQGRCKAEKDFNRRLKYVWKQKRSNLLFCSSVDSSLAQVNEFGPCTGHRNPMSHLRLYG